ncbi:MAG: type II toxin-antitoxin system RelE/ParE family toxin [Hyphomicrobiaceae bacterium]|jgi:plasmid stabilization system protein ParE
MKLRWDAQALQDIREIHRYIAANSSRAAAGRVRGHFKARARMLLQSTRMGVPSNQPGVRILQPTRYPYRIYYTVQGDEIVILHIRHTSRQAPGNI